MENPKWANDIQVGGEHYRSSYQHWDLAVNTGMGYLEGNTTRYVVRWRDKNGVEDLRKALHYVDKLLEEADKSKKNCVEEAVHFCKVNRLTELESCIIEKLAAWETLVDIVGARDLILRLIEEASSLTSEPRPVPATDSNKHAERA